MGAALEIDHRRLDPVPRPAHVHPASRALPRVVGRPQQPRLPLEVVVDFPLVPDVVARGEDVDAHGEQFLGDQRRDPESAGGVLTVGHHQVDALAGNDFRQALGDGPPAGGREHVPDEQQIHSTLAAPQGPAGGSGAPRERGGPVFDPCFVNGVGVLRAPSGFSIAQVGPELAHRRKIESDSLYLSVRFKYW